MAREGSATLRSVREKKEKNAMRQKFWELGGTRMGNVVGVKESGGENDISPEIQGSTKDNDANKETKETEKLQQQEDDDGQGEIDYKKSSGFAAHVTGKENNGPVSEFAKKKSIRQQREFLPAFTIRDELLNVIRENNIVIVVGETGSG